MPVKCKYHPRLLIGVSEIEAQRGHYSFSMRKKNIRTKRSTLILLVKDSFSISLWPTKSDVDHDQWKPGKKLLILSNILLLRIIPQFTSTLTVVHKSTLYFWLFVCIFSLIIFFVFFSYNYYATLFSSNTLTSLLAFFPVF